MIIMRQDHYAYCHTNMIHVVGQTNHAIAFSLNTDGTLSNRDINSAGTMAMKRPMNLKYLR